MSPAPPATSMSMAIAWGRLRDRMGGAPGWLAWAPVLPAAAYAVVMALSHRQLVHDINWNSDVIAPMVIATALHQLGGHQQVALGEVGSYTTLWFDWVTYWSPWHRQLWAAAPYTLDLATVALLGWASWRAAGRWAAMATCVIAFAAAPTVLYTEMAQAVRVTTWFNLALLAASLVLLPRLSGAAHLAVASGVAVVTGLDLASDPYLAVCGLVPFVAAATLSGVRQGGRPGRRMALTALLMGLATILIALAAQRLMRHAGFHSSPPPLRFIGEDQLGRQSSLLLHGLLEMGNGLFFGEPVTFGSVLTAACGLAVLLGMPGLGLVLASAVRPAGGAEPGDRLLLTSFWSVSALLVIAAFLATTAVRDVTGIRYLIPVLLALAAVIPLHSAAGRHLRLTVAGAITLVAGMSAINLHQVARSHSFEPGTSAHLLPVVASVLESHGLTRGYAGYWDAHPLTWHTDGRLQVHPVVQGEPCLGTDPRRLCSFPFSAVASWYSPRPGLPTFLLVDPSDGYVPGPPPAYLGPPSARLGVGPATIFVFPFDIAAGFTN